MMTPKKWFDLYGRGKKEKKKRKEKINRFLSTPTFAGYLRTAVILFQPTMEANKGVRKFPEGIYPKVNTLPQLEIELAFFKTTAQYFGHYATSERINEEKNVEISHMKKITN